MSAYNKLRGDMEIQIKANSKRSSENKLNLLSSFFDLLDLILFQRETKI